MTSNQYGKKDTDKVTILVVDDQAATRILVRTILKSVGFTDVLLADCGATALELLRTESVNLVIADWNMPNGNGIELLREVRERENLKNVPFLMLTAEAYRENVSEALAAGVTDYIAKPFTAAILLEKVDKVLAGKR